jgi:type I restriction enzyme S subunit
MTNWTKKRLADIADSCLGKMLDKEKNKGEYQPYLANLNVQWGEFKLESLQKMRFEEREQERFGLKNGDLIICEGGDPGRCAIWRDELPDMMVQKALHRLRVHPKYSSDFLYYRMKLAGMNRELDRHFIGSTIKHLTGIGLKDVEFEFPDFKEQKSIAVILRSLDKKIELNNKINAELEAMAKLIYDYWFVQFDFPDANGKPYKSSGGKMVYNEELMREIPDGWEVKPLSELISFERGISYKSREITEKGIPMINLNSFNLSGRYKNKGLKYFTGSYKENKVVSAGDLVIAITDVTRNADIIGKAFTIPDLFDDDILISCDVAKVIPSSLVNAQFLEPLFNSEHYHRYIKYFASGTLVLHLNLDGVNWYEIPLPPIDILNKYRRLRKDIDKKLTLAIHENKQLVELRDWLLPMLMNGQVTIMND